MNSDQRKHLKGRLAELRFRPCYKEEKHDTPAIKSLRARVSELSEKIKLHEDGVCEKLKKVQTSLEKKKNRAYEIIFGSNFDDAVEAVKEVEENYERANS